MSHAGPAFFSSVAEPIKQESTSIDNPITEVIVKNPEEVHSDPVIVKEQQYITMNETTEPIIEQLPTDPPEHQVTEDSKFISAPEKKANGMFNTARERNAFIFFIIPIVLMSFVSMLHLVDFFSIGNNNATAWLLALAFEMASLSTIVALVLLKKLKKTALWSILVLLYLLQLLGNIYSPFAYIKPDAGLRLFQFFGLTPSELSAQRIIAIIQGAILPTVVILLFKITSNYLSSTPTSDDQQVIS